MVGGDPLLRAGGADRLRRGAQAGAAGAALREDEARTPRGADGAGNRGNRAGASFREREGIAPVRTDVTKMVGAPGGHLPPPHCDPSERSRTRVKRKRDGSVTIYPPGCHGSTSYAIRIASTYSRPRL